MFKWDTLKDVADHELWYQGKPVPGKMLEVELENGPKIRVWGSDDGQQYFCHGLTFGDKDAPGGAVSPFSGWPVETILRAYYGEIPEGVARVGDILVCHGVAPATTPHSAVISEVILMPNKDCLDYSMKLRTKNGLSPEATMTLKEIVEIYGESFRIYRRR